ncbi:MAG TPA: delta-60 repeat domain-containing protein [Burkholderiales bacterium]|nr:delta-60 repeat domain-containing protein [Burkholderiales bacterium]
MEAQKCLKVLATSVVGLVLSLSIVSRAEAAPGDLDPSFGGDGKVTTDFFGGADAAKAVGIQRDSRIVTAGNAFNSQTGGYNFALARYNNNGGLDPTFDGDGKVTTNLAGNTPSSSSASNTANALVIQPNGKIVVAGVTFNSATAFNNFAVLRYNSQGDLDSSFGIGGVVRTEFDGVNASANDVALQPDGKIIAVGTIGNRLGNQDIALARFNPDGQPDSSFGTAGKVITDLTSDDGANAVHLTSDGKILVAGTSFCLTFPCPAREFILLRYNQNGSLDPTFGIDGKVTTDFRIRDVANALDIGPDGKIVIAGFADSDCTGSCPVFALARYNPDGDLDTTFGVGGKITTPLGRVARATAAIIREGPKPKIVVGGYYQERAVCGTVGETYACDFALVRYNWDGTLDSSFGDGGIATTDFGGTQDRAFDLAIQRNGKIILAGNAGGDFALARFLSDTCPFPVIPPAPSNGFNDAEDNSGCRNIANAWWDTSATVASNLRGIRQNVQGFRNFR